MTTTNLIERLRSHGTNTYDLYKAAKEAAELLEAQAKQIEALETSLKDAQSKLKIATDIKNAEFSEINKQLIARQYYYRGCSPMQKDKL